MNWKFVQKFKGRRWKFASLTIIQALGRLVLSQSETKLKGTLNNIHAFTLTDFLFTQHFQVELTDFPLLQASSNN